MRKGDIGTQVANLQNLLIMAGFSLATTAIFDDKTEAALIAFQRRVGLVADGIAGPKSMTALAIRERNRKHLSEQDLGFAAQRLGIPVAAIKAVNEVESKGAGFLDDGRPVILYERHVVFRLLGESGMNDIDVKAISDQYPNLINQQRGGYRGGEVEWSRLTSACQIIDPTIAQAACSWGQYQIMGYHWKTLGYASIESFVAEMRESEGLQLAAFVRFIEADPALHKVLKARNWTDFARRYNGPAYRENLYDAKLARAYERYASA